MSLQERVQSDIAVAMRGGDGLRRDVLRMVTSAAYSVEKRQGRPLTDDEYLAVLSREVKTRRFYAHLYVGLYYEAAGQAERAREHITLAAETYAEDNYMSDVARVHAATFKAPQ